MIEQLSSSLKTKQKTEANQLVTNLIIDYQQMYPQLMWILKSKYHTNNKNLPY